MENYNVKVSSTGGVSFGTFSWIVWIVFMILYYGTGTIADWPVFWIWFPFWLPFALAGAGILLAIICALILAKIDN